MSDGNFNRALLPSTPYRSGMKMGAQIMQKHAREAFAIVMERNFPQMSTQDRTYLEAEFIEELRGKL